MASKPILVLVEQDTSVGRRLSRGLEEWFEVRLATSLANAMELIKGECIDGLVIDSANSEAVEPEALKTIQHLDQDLPILLCSASEPAPGQCQTVIMKQGMSFTDLAREIKRAMIPYQVNRIYMPLRTMLNESLQRLDEMKILSSQS